jgi:hypothetical protein
VRTDTQFSHQVRLDLFGAGLWLTTSFPAAMGSLQPTSEFDERKRKENERKIAFISSYFLFLIGTFQRVTSGKMKKSIPSQLASQVAQQALSKALLHQPC